MNKRSLALGCVIFLASLAFCQQPSPAPQFSLRFDKAGITSLKYVGDKYGTDYIADEATLGHVRIRYKMGDCDWQQFSTEDAKNRHDVLESGAVVGKVNAGQSPALIAVRISRTGVARVTIRPRPLRH